MHQPARIPEIFDQILQNTPVLEFGSRTPLPRKWKTNFLSWVQIWAYPEHPPPLPWKWKTITFFLEFKSELTQNTHTHRPPPKWKTNFLSWVQIWAYPDPPGSGWSMWRLYLPRIPSSFCSLHKSGVGVQNRLSFSHYKMHYTCIWNSK